MWCDYFNRNVAIAKICYNIDIQDYSSIHLYGNKSPQTRKGRFSGGISVYFKSYLNGRISIAEKH